MKRKILYVASIDKHIIRFHLPSLEWFKKEGFEVHVACKGNAEIPFCDVQHNLDFVRSPYSLGHFKAYRQLKALLFQEDFQIVHCHTPMASVLTRIAARDLRNKRGLKVIYTAHGFQFTKESPLFTWLTFYPIEKYLSRLTDCLIVINRDDYKLALKKFRTKDIRLISGMGVDSRKFFPVNSARKAELREKFGISQEAFVLVYAAEFIKRKNHRFIIHQAVELKKQIPGLVILFAGRGELFQSIKEEVKRLGLDDTVKLLGFREDIHDVFCVSDLGISTSKNEGLGINIIEEMMCGLPVVVTNVSGHREIVGEGLNGYFYFQGDGEMFRYKINLVFEKKNQYASMSRQAIQTAQRFTLAKSMEELSAIYKDYAG